MPLAIVPHKKTGVKTQMGDLDTVLEVFITFKR